MFKLDYRFRETVYRITVTQASPADRESAVWLDGERQAGNAIPLVDDRIDHLVDVVVHPRLVDALA
jgi:cellobiose phosphorylase